MTTYIFRLGTAAGRMSEKHSFLGVFPWFLVTRTDPALRAGPPLALTHPTPDQNRLLPPYPNSLPASSESRPQVSAEAI